MVIWLKFFSVVETVPTLVTLSKFQRNVPANCQCPPDQALRLMLVDSERDIILHGKGTVSRRYNIKLLEYSYKAGYSIMRFPLSCESELVVLCAQKIGNSDLLLRKCWCKNCDMLTEWNVCLWFDFLVVLTKLCGILRHCPPQRHCTIQITKWNNGWAIIIRKTLSGILLSCRKFILTDGLF